MEYVDYIQSTGTQYINTGVIPDANTIVEMKYSVQEIKNIGPHILSNSAWYFPFPRNYGGASHFFANRMGTQVQINLTPEINTEYTIKAYPNGQITINNTVYDTIESGTGSDTSALYMFTYSGSPSSLSYTAKAKMYYCKIWDGETLIRDFCPALNDDGVAGLYDKVNGQFYGNDGDGVFYYMPSSSTSYLINSKTLTGIANEIKIKTGSTDTISVSNMSNIISDIETPDSFINRSLSGMYVNSNVSKVGSYAFAYCSSLTSVDLPACTTVNNDAFAKCSSLTSANLPACTIVGKSAFTECSSLISVNLPACTTIGLYAFMQCTSLTSVDLPICTTISGYAFAYCNSLTSVNLPVCTTVSSYALAECKNLATVDLPACTTVGNSAFTRCSSLTSVNLPVCTSVGNSAFNDCPSLTSVNLPVCTSVGNSAFVACKSLTSVNLPSCTAVGANAFRACYSLVSINLPVCTTIGSSAFYICSNLTNVDLPVCTRINASTFYSCGNLVSVNLPVCSYIGSYAFYSCTKLRSLTLGSNAVCSLYDSAVFSKVVALLSFYVPASLVDSYKTATNWSYYSSRITAIVE